MLLNMLALRNYCSQAKLYLNWSLSKIIKHSLLSFLT